MAQRVVNWHKCAGARAQYDTKNTKVGRVLIFFKPKFISTYSTMLQNLTRVFSRIVDSDI